MSTEKQPKRRKTGVVRRKAQKRVGRPLLVEDGRVRSPGQAEEWWMERARVAMAEGRQLRVSAEEDLAAFEVIHEVIEAHREAFEQRLVKPVLVAGVERLAKRLEAALEVGAPVDEDEPSSRVTRALGERLVPHRAAILRLWPGSRFAAMRARFGLNEPLNVRSARSVARAARALLAGRRSEHTTAAAQLVTDEEAAAIRQGLAEIRRELGQAAGRRQAARTTAVQRELLATALELFYDRYAAAVNLVFVGSELERVRALSLIPRRKDRRGKATGVAGA
jgi:hypothetical protein